MVLFVLVVVLDEDFFMLIETALFIRDDGANNADVEVDGDGGEKERSGERLKDGFRFAATATAAVDGALLSSSSMRY